MHGSPHRWIATDLARRCAAAIAVAIGVAQGAPVGPAVSSRAMAAETPCASAEGEPVWAERVVAGDEIVLVDGRRVRLAGVEAPKPPLGLAGAAATEAVAVAEAARIALADRVEGREIALTEIGVDRHGRRLGHLYDIEAGQWIEAELVAAGHLRVISVQGPRPCIAALSTVERRAIGTGRGLWGSAAFAVATATATDLIPRIGRWTVVEGRVRSVGRSGGHIWLNFGEDFRRDFAVVMKDKDLDGFRAAGFDAMAARGWWVRVRGVVVHRGGPRIAVEIPGDIERVKR